MEKKRERLSDWLTVFGAAAVSGGIWLLLGLGFAMIAAGLLCIGIGALIGLRGGSE